MRQPRRRAPARDHEPGAGPIACLRVRFPRKWTDMDGTGLYPNECKELAQIFFSERSVSVQRVRNRMAATGAVTQPEFKQCVLI